MTGAQNKLVMLTRELMAEWAQTKQTWTDAKSQEFEKRFLDELVTALNAAVTNIDSLEQILRKIHADCA